jgi:uncharacterized membrane protein
MPARLVRCSPQARAAIEGYDRPMVWLDGVLALVALAVAIAVQPWRALPVRGLPWPWLGWSALLPLLWGIDRIGHSPLALGVPGSCLLMLMAGWPLAMVALPPVAVVTALLTGLGPAEALHRLVWLGVMPATLAMGLGAVVRRWLPRHLFVYILGRGFFATALADFAAAALAVSLGGAPRGTGSTDLIIARGLVAFSDAFVTGTLVAIFVAFRPHWLATYADRLYLPPKPS